MKVRFGFVSNSSTTSFLIYGARLPEGMTRKTLDCSELDLDISFYYGEMDGCYIGASWDRVGLNETGQEFMGRVEDAIAKVTGLPLNCTTIEEAYYNG